ncbi:MAG: diversity-generating retroelement protein Avd [Rhodoferax sp.]|nr:diversity-generating retroelement protein Avd [Rhodoferax sp.]
MPQATDPPEPRLDTRAGRTNVAAVEGCYQLVLWLIPVLDNLPRRQKFQLGDRMQTTAMQVLETLIEAAYTRDRSALLQQANLELEKLRVWIRLAHELQLLDFKRYEHTARLIDDLGRQVGGWLRSQQGRGHPSRQRADARKERSGFRDFVTRTPTKSRHRPTPTTITNVRPPRASRYGCASPRNTLRSFRATATTALLTIMTNIHGCTEFGVRPSRRDGVARTPLPPPTRRNGGQSPISLWGFALRSRYLPESGSDPPLHRLRLSDRHHCPLRPSDRHHCATIGATRAFNFGALNQVIGSGWPAAVQR